MDQKPEISDLKSEISTPKPEKPQRTSEISNLKSEISKLTALAESCSRQIRGWANTLQNSDIAGPRHLNEQSRRNYESRQRAAAFKRQIEDTLRHARPELFSDPPEA